MKRLALLLVVLSCRTGHEPGPLPGAGASAPSAVPSAVPSAAPSNESSATPTAESGAPFAVQPTVVMKHTLTNGEFSGHIDAEPGVLLGPQKKLVKAFDCLSKGVPPANVIGVCVGFKSCEPVTPTDAHALAELDCSGPKLQLLLLRTETGLVFKVVDGEHPLAKRKMSEIALPPGTYPKVAPFKRQNVSANVDL